MNIQSLKLLPVIFLIMLLPCLSSAQQLKLASKPSLTLEVAKEVAKKAAEYAKSNNWNVVISIVDDGGNIMYLERMDGVQLGSIDVSIQKAKTALTFKRKSKAFADAIKGGRPELVALPGALPVEGGVPLVFNNQIIGAIGISGVTSEQDGMIAEHAAEAFADMVK